MFIIYGQGFYGKVDQVPGLMHVATLFWHGFWFPMFPCGSYVILEQPAGSGAVEPRWLGWSFKSIACAWIRCLLVVAVVYSALIMIFLTVHLGIVLVEGEKKFGPKIFNLVLVVLLSIGLFALLAAILYCSYWFTRATPKRAIELAGRIGIEPEVVAHYFINHNNLPVLEDFRREQEESLDR